MTIGGADPEILVTVGNHIKFIDVRLMAKPAETCRGLVGPTGSRVTTVLVNPETTHGLVGSVAGTRHDSVMEPPLVCHRRQISLSLARGSVFLVRVALPGPAQIWGPVRIQAICLQRRVGRIVDIVAVAAVNLAHRIDRFTIFPCCVIILICCLRSDQSGRTGRIGGMG